MVELAPGKQYVQIDLGKPAQLAALVVWHYHQEARVYRDVVVQVAEDPDFIIGVTTLFNNDDDNSSGLGAGKDKEYLETYEGKLHRRQGCQGPLRPPLQQRQHLQRREPLHRSGGLRQGAGVMTRSVPCTSASPCNPRFRSASPRRRLACGSGYGVVLVLLIAAGALAFRLHRLDLRPFHVDEAVQAVKAGELYDSGQYRYDPLEFHGPSLYYLTLPVLKLSGAGMLRRGR